jgi:hypothetical protein
MTQQRLSSWTWKTTLIAGACSLLVGGLMAACGDDPGDDDPGDGDGCILGGHKCDFGCADNLGCVECLADLDCESGKPFCVLGKCQECSGSDECPTGQACFPREFKCEPACTDDGDCAPDEELCEPLSGACVGCLDDDDCGGKEPVCEPNRDQCSECASDLDCGAAKPACNLQDGKCKECLVDDHCDYGYLCAGDHKCHLHCTNSSLCCYPKKPLFKVAWNDCVVCLNDNDCPSAEPLCKNDDKCVECLINDDCPTSLPVCKDDRCIGCDKHDDCLDSELPICKGQTCIECDKDEHCTDVLAPKCENEHCVAE